MLPNFLVIGAPKAGSTSLYHYLRSHPEVFMSETKEVNFFLEERNWGRGREWYERQFDGADGARAVGEASVRYSMYPKYQGVPERIAALVPDVRLVYVVRDPVARMVSHYEHRVRANRDDGRLEESLLENPVYLDTSRYALQIERYLEHFAPDRLLVVVSEQLRDDRDRVLEDVFGFLGVDRTWRSETLRAEHNVSSGQQAPRGAMRRIMRVPGWNRFAVAMPESLKRAGRRMTHGAVERAELPDHVRRELEARLRDDVSALRRYVHGEFDGWGIA